MKRRFCKAVIAASLIVASGFTVPMSTIAATATNSDTTTLTTLAAAVSDGTRKNPYDIKKGVKVPDYGGTAYLKLKATYKGSSAEKKAKTLMKKGNRGYLSHQLDQKGKRQVVLLKVYVEAIEGYETSTLYGSSVLSLYHLYNKKATNELKNVSSLYLDKGRAEDVNLYNGGHDTIYIGLMLPKNVKSFNVVQRVPTDDGSRDLWMRYNL